MKVKKPTDFAYHLTNYFSAFLPNQKGLSKNTIFSYRDTFKIFLKHCNERYNLKPENLELINISKELITSFLECLQVENGNSISTRNQRLSALHAFFKYLQLEAPQNMFLYQQILAIPFKKCAQKVPNYLTFEGVKSVLSMPNLETLRGRRDLAMLSLLYDTGARVSELANIEVSHIRLEDPATIRLTGKGNKTRIVPLMHKTTNLLKEYIKDHNLFDIDKRNHPLFWNRIGQKLTSAGIRYVLDKYTEQARRVTPEFIPQGVTPHSIRHSKAVHLLQAGVNLVYIRDLLGHVDIKTTEIYAKVDPKMKRDALEKVYKNPNPDNPPSWNQDKSLMTWLSALGTK